MTDNRFQWDYPTQGLNHPRTMCEAFGPHARLSVRQPIQWRTTAAYTLAAAVAMLALVAAFN